MKTIFRTNRCFEKDSTEEVVMPFAFFLEDVQWWEKGDGIFKNRPVATIVKLRECDAVYTTEPFDNFHKLMEAFNASRSHPLLTQN